MLARLVVGLGLWSMIGASFAAPTLWQIIPKESQITFTAKQNGSPVSGRFKTFDGTIQFDPADLKNSKVQINVDTSSVSTSYGEVAETLKKSEWFDVKVFPEAKFVAEQFSKVDDKNYDAIGTLTIRDKSLPITLRFTLNNYTADKALATGYTTLKRNAFGVGQGEWASTDNVKDEVKVEFTLSAKK